jgi:dienelactone hydrolase
MRALAGRAAALLPIVALLSSLALAAVSEREITFKAPDGAKLKGTYFSPQKPGPGIMLFHMCRDDRRDWLSTARLLAREGFHVLAYDHRGFGQSEGNHMKGMQLEDAIATWRRDWIGDMKAGVEFLRSQPGVDKQRLGAGGGSCGVYMSLLMAESFPQQVRSLVLLAGPIDESSKETVKRLPHLPILAAADEADGPAPRWMKEITDASANPKTKLLSYQKAGHGTDMFRTVKELQSMVVRWFVDTLR